MDNLVQGIIRRERLSELVVAGIKEFIIANDLREGDRLPTEQQMAEISA